MSNIASATAGSTTSTSFHISRTPSPAYGRRDGSPLFRCNRYREHRKLYYHRVAGVESRRNCAIDYGCLPIGTRQVSFIFCAVISVGKLICARGSEGHKQIWIGVTPEPGTSTDPSLGMRAGKHKLNALSSHAEAMRNLPFDLYKDESTTLSTGRPHRFHHFRDLCRH